VEIGDGWTGNRTGISIYTEEDEHIVFMWDDELPPDTLTFCQTSRTSDNEKPQLKLPLVLSKERCREEPGGKKDRSCDQMRQTIPMRDRPATGGGPTCPNSSS